MNETPMRNKLTKNDKNPDCHQNPDRHQNPACHQNQACHPEFISGSQTMSGQEIPKQVRDDRESVFSSEHYLWLTLAHILKNRFVLSKNLMERFAAPERVFSSSFEDLCSVEGITPAIAW